MYKLGEIESETRQQLGIDAVNYCGLGLPDDENIGRRVRYKNPTCEIEKEIHIIIGRQKAWGYDESGNYTMIDAYRGVAEGKDPFGRPLHLYEVEFVDWI